eukprot:416247-Amphidinium_carterae.1
MGWLRACLVSVGVDKVMEGGKDVASGIREKSRFIVELCEDSELLSKERKKNNELTKRMNSVCNGSVA